MIVDCNRILGLGIIGIILMLVDVKYMLYSMSGIECDWLVKYKHMTS